MLFNKPLENVSEDDLKVLIANEVSEGKAIEYKQAAIGNDRDNKKEFLADVSSFANASGGYLIIGMREEAGVAIEICGLDLDADAELQRLENLMRDNLDPRIPGISMRAIPLASGVAIVVQIPRSWSQPHAVNFGGHWRFYSRNSAGKYPLDVSEVRTAFTLSETIADRIREFRAERLGNIVAGETPVPIQEGAIVVLHVIPLTAFDPKAIFDVAKLANLNEKPAPIFSHPSSHRHNFDGFLTHDLNRSTSLSHAYLQVFRNGIIESVNSGLLNSDYAGPVIPSADFEYGILDALQRFLDTQMMLGVYPPLLVMLSLLEVSGYRMAAGRSQSPGATPHPIEKRNLIIPEILVDHLDLAPAEIMRPAFDAVWNATGWPRSMSYSDDGRWLGS